MTSQGTEVKKYFTVREFVYSFVSTSFPWGFAQYLAMMTIVAMTQTSRKIVITAEIMISGTDAFSIAVISVRSFKLTD